MGATLIEVAAMSVALVFLVAGVEKALQFTSFVDGLAQWGVSGASTQRAVGAIIVCVELFVPAAVFAGATRAGLAAAAAMLAVLSVLAARSVANGSSHPCMCLSVSASPQVSATTLARNAGLFMLAVLALTYGGEFVFPLPVIIAASSAVSALLLWENMRALRERMDRLTGSTAGAS